MGKTSLVIAYRNEPDLQNTIEDAQRNMRKVSIYTEDDVNGEGPGQCRHRAIMRAINDGCTQIIITDAHMRFGTDAIGMMQRFIRANPMTLACGYCYHNPTQSFDGTPYAGAELVRFSKFNSEHFAVSAKWRSNGTPGRIPAVMGAFYGMSDKLYLAMGQPLRVLHAWGLDEELLSMGAYLCGDGVELLEGCEVAHLARDSSPFEMTPQYINEVWANRIKVCDCLPVAKPVQARLKAWVQRSPAVYHNYDAIAAILARDSNDVEEVRAAWSKRNTTEQIAAWFDTFINGDGMVQGAKAANMPTPAPAKAPALPPKVIRRNTERCDWCGAENSFVQIEGMRDRGALTTASARCKYCHRKVQIRMIK